MLCRGALILACSLATTAANAQQTNCYWAGAIWSCNTRTPQPNSNSSTPWQILQESQRQQSDQFQRNMWLWQQQRQRQQEQAAAQAQEQLRQSVGQALASGDCASAERMALSAGDIGLAGEVRSYCASGN